MSRVLLATAPIFAERFMSVECVREGELWAVHGGREKKIPMQAVPSPVHGAPLTHRCTALALSRTLHIIH